MFASSDRTGPLRRRDPLTWANILLLVAANALRGPLRSLLMSTELGYGPVDAVRTGEHSRSRLTNKISAQHEQRETAEAYPLSLSQNKLFCAS
jgi:hypothetical protein